MYVLEYLSYVVLRPMRLFLLHEKNSRFNGVPTEERLHWRTFLVKLGADNLKGARNEELFVASHKYVITHF